MGYFVVLFEVCERIPSYRISVEMANLCVAHIVSLAGGIDCLTLTCMIFTMVAHLRCILEREEVTDGVRPRQP